MGFIKGIVAGIQQLTGMSDTAFQQELAAQQNKTQYLESPDRECTYLLDIYEVTQQAPKCVLTPVTQIPDMKVQVFGFYRCVDFRKPSLFISIVNQGEYPITPSQKRTNYVKFGDYFQKVEFSQLNLTGISLAKHHGLIEIPPKGAVMLICHGEFTTYNPDNISMALNYDRQTPEEVEQKLGQFKDMLNWVCQNHPVIT